jgi:hypothetical protein
MKENESSTTNDEWDAALNRLLEGVNLDDLSIPTASGAKRAKLTFEQVRDRVAEQLREKISSERMRRETIERLDRQFEDVCGVVDDVLEAFSSTLLGAFHGGGEVKRAARPNDNKSQTWQVFGFRSPGTSGQREVVVGVVVMKKGVDALDRGQPALECRVSTPRNPRLVDFTVGTGVREDLEDAVCRAYQDILGTLKFEPASDAGV